MNYIIDIICVKMYYSEHHKQKNRKEDAMKKDKTNMYKAIILMELATRLNVAKVSSVDSALRHVSKIEQDVMRKDIINCFKSFEKDGFGVFVRGRKGHKSRFVWSCPSNKVINYYAFKATAYDLVA